MNRKAIATTVARFTQALCLVGLLSVPFYSQASTVSLRQVDGVYLLKAEDMTIKEVFDYIEDYKNDLNGVKKLHPREWQRRYGRSTLPYFDHFLRDAKGQTKEGAKSQ